MKEKKLLHLKKEVPETLKISNESPKLIIARFKPDHHYELHFTKYVEFRDLNGKCLGYSEVEPVA